MNNRDRFLRTLSFQSVDRLPMMEWAAWWDLTIKRWHNEGLPGELNEPHDIADYLGLDAHRQYWITPSAPSCPTPESHGAALITNRDEYHAFKQHLYPEHAFDKESLRADAARQQSGDLVVWLAFEGYFWFPRVLLGIEPHLYAFYDQGELMHEINEDLLAFQLRQLDAFCEICTPDFMILAEDLSYNHGPMLSEVQFDEFLAPYYRRIVPALVDRGIIPFVDTDGDVSKPMDWMMKLGIQGFLPLERMAGVDVAGLRKVHPDVKLIGAFDKTVMHLGEERMRREFERLLAVMRQGGFIPSVDHQTPPEVSLSDYRLYLKLLREYAGNPVS